jgi:hypothetical protein
VWWFPDEMTWCLSSMNSPECESDPSDYFAKSSRREHDVIHS